MDQSRLHQYLRLIKRWWWLAVASMLIAGVSSYLGLQRTPRIYQSTTTVMVGQSLGTLSPTGSDLAIGQQLTHTYAQLVRRESLLAAAAAQLGLAEPPSPESVTAQQVAGTQLLEISVLDTSPERARALADAIAQQLILLTPAAREITEREAFVQEQLDDLEAKIAATREEMEQERAKFEAASSASAVQQHQANIDALQQQLTYYQNSYASLLANTQQATNRVSVVEPATLPTRPVSPSVMSSMALAMAIGLALAVSGALVTELLDGRVRSAEEAVRYAGLPLFASIPPLDHVNELGGLVTVYAPRSPAAESFRLLGTRIALESGDGPLATVMFVSPGPGEGKSLAVANVGVAFAEAGREVLIVDSDLRRPSQHGLFGLENELGLADLLRDPHADLSRLIQATRVPRLSLMAAGETASSPGSPLAMDNLNGEVKALLQEAYKDPYGLLASEHLGAALERLQERYRLVLFDSPPPSIFPDAAILASRVDAVLMMADVTVTQRALLAEVAEQLRHSGAHLLGLVLNRSREGDASSRQAYYRYYYDSEGHRQRQRAESSGVPGGEPSRPSGLMARLQAWRAGGMGQTHPAPHPAASVPPEAPKDEAHQAEESAS